jgi:hypothetical protein
VDARRWPVKICYLIDLTFQLIERYKNENHLEFDGSRYSNMPQLAKTSPRTRR